MSVSEVPGLFLAEGPPKESIYQRLFLKSINDGATVVKVNLRCALGTVVNFNNPSPCECLFHWSESINFPKLWLNLYYPPSKRHHVHGLFTENICSSEIFS